MQGFAELEYGMLRYMGAIDDSTPIVTSGKKNLNVIFCLNSKSSRHTLFPFYLMVWS